MKIVHIAISCFYIEGWGYQENLLPKYHKLAGHDVYMISSRFDKDEFDKPRLRPVQEYVNRDGICVSILDYAKRSRLQKVLRLTPIQGLYEKLEEIKPDIIFVHGGTSISSLDTVKYKKAHPRVKVYADQHADYYNSPVKTFKQKLLIKGLFGHYARVLAKYTDKYWGVTPWRVDYLQKVYGISPEKTDLLVMGADDQYVDYSHRAEISKQLREKYGVGPNSFLVVTGGKIDKTKNIHILMKAAAEVKSDREIALALYGSIGEDVKAEVEDLLRNNPNFHFIGWLDTPTIIQWMLAADLCVFPGTHSVLWEACVACGTPLVVNDWPGMHHIDIGGNCIFTDGSDKEKLKSILSNLLDSPSEYSQMLSAASSKRREDFLYSNIAKKAICCEQGYN